jgi:hypothetical protein
MHSLEFHNNPNPFSNLANYQFDSNEVFKAIPINATSEIKL